VTSKTIERIPRSLSLREEGYRYLKNLILSAQLAPGTLLVEEQIAAQLGISRTPLREVLALLENEGLVTRTMHRGTFVTDISLDDIRQLFEVRESLERLAARRAATTIPMEQLETIQQEFHESAQELQRGIYDRYYESHRLLHQLILKSADNLLLIQIMNTLDDRIKRLQAIAGAQPERHVHEGYQEQERLLNALLARDPNAAEQAMSNHLQKALARITIQVHEHFEPKTNKENEL